MEPWKIRVYEELSDLEVKRNMLDNFILNSSEFNNFPLEQQHLLRRQKVSILDYALILRDRLNL